jgi:acetyl esterase/lipase
MKLPRPAVLVIFTLLAATFLPAQAEKIIADLTFVRTGTSTLQLDLYLPESTKPTGLIIWVHGGAWRAGSRKDVDLKGMVTRGWAVASVDYRQSTVARFPAQIHDLKAAVRYLRAHAIDYDIPPSRFVIAGSSAGAHLAALVGVTNGHTELEGTEGFFTGQSSAVQAVVSLYGASDLTTILGQSTPHGLEVRAPALDLLLGAQPDAVLDLAKLASPVFHVDPNDPPLLLEHGDQDAQMPINQSHELHGAYEKLQRPVVFKVMHGSGHGGPAFTDEANLNFIDAFLREHLPELKSRTVKTE